MSDTWKVDALMSIPRNREVILWMGGNGNEMYAVGSLKDSDHNATTLVLTIIYFCSSRYVYLQLSINKKIKVWMHSKLHHPS